MKRLYEKKEDWFAILWIVIYVLSCSVADNISEAFGLSKWVTFPVLVVMSIYLYFFVKKNHLEEKYGFCRSRRSLKDAWYYIPLFAVVITKLFVGISVKDPGTSLRLALSMLCVGFLEELIFRGFLFKAMAKDGMKSAVIVSALTFGAGHIVNAINGSGQSLAHTMIQIVFAIAFGFCMVLLFLYTGTLWPCVLVHGFYNACSAIVNPDSLYILIAQMIVLIVYALYLFRKLKEEGVFQ